MNATRLRQIEDIYQGAAENAPADRSAFIRAKCRDDVDLRLEVESLLSFDDISDSFIDGSADAIVADMFADEVSIELIGTTLGHYRIERLLGEGGMGKVYLADDLRLTRKVALKLLPPTLIEHPDRLRRFKHEAKAASGLNHPNILTIHEFGSDQGSNYIVTEFVDGVTLREKIRVGLSLKETLEIASQVASALAAAHSAGIIHRDIKPENIMIRPDGFLKVLDFGLAKLSTPPEPTEQGLEAATMFRTEPGMVMGTPNYMSPEQARGVKVDGRTDVWSLGVMIYEMATGKLPFAGETQTDVLVAILNQPVPIMDIFERDAPAELRHIIEKTLAKNADERYANIEELATDLKRICNRLEFENELNRNQSGPKLTNRGLPLETATRVMPSADVAVASEPAKASGAGTDKHRKYVPALIAALAACAVVVAGIVWYLSKPETKSDATATASQPAQPVATRTLTYSLTVQSFTDGRYKEPFALSGEMLFRNKDRIRINVKGVQPGYLYILNQGPDDAGGKAYYNILFPTPATNDGLAFLSGNEEIQIPKQSWFELDEKEGTELIWLLWSEKTIAELESAKRFANPADRGRIKDPELNQMIVTLLQSHPASGVNVERDDVQKVSHVRASGDFIAHAIKLEHH